MTTNQTIDGVLVPPELLSYWAECLESAGFKDRPAEMRALLDKEVSGDSRAPLPQGEPVAWQLIMNGDQKEISGRIGPPPSWENLKRHGYRVEPLYAEQPAPVAVVLPERKSVNTHNSHDWDEGHADGWVAYDTELKRLNPSL